VEGFLYVEAVCPPSYSVDAPTLLEEEVAQMYRMLYVR